MEDYVERIAACIARGKVYKAAPYPPDMRGQDGADEIAADALSHSVPPKVLLNGCMLGMERVGKEFSEHRAAVTNLVVSAAAMNAVLKHIKPFLESGEVQRKGKVVIGTVAGDLHDIGKNLVSMIITGGGYEVVDLGVDVPSSRFLSAIGQDPGCVVVERVTSAGSRRTERRASEAPPGHPSASRRPVFTPLRSPVPPAALQGSQPQGPQAPERRQRQPPG